VGGTWNSTVACAVVGEVDQLQGFKGDRTVVNPLSILKIVKEVPFLGGQRVTAGVVDREFIGYPIGNYATNVPDPRNFFGSMSNARRNELAWTILSKTNPSRPHVNVPAAIGELRDLPSLVKDWGGGLLRKAAKGNLSWRFALAPMLSDLRKLSDFTRAVNKRIRYLKKLRDGKTLRTRCNLGTSLQSTTPSRMLIHSQGATLYAFRHATNTEQLWGTAEWKLLPDTILPKGDDELGNLARRLAGGITSHGALETLWELTPWSWFVDWFSNVGEILAATNNTVGCTWGRIAIMRMTTGQYTYDFDPTGSSTWPTFSGWYNQKTTGKERFVGIPVVPVPLPRLPLIDGGKFSILLSLAALRR
jgi:hypothetical protein